MSASDRNVFVGISLQNKGLTDADYTNIVKQAKAEFDFQKLIFLVADDIELINERVFTKGHENKLKARVEALANELESEIRSACDPNDINSGRIETCRWQDILDKGYWNCFFEVQRIFYTNPVFQSDITYAIEEYAERRKKFFSQAESLYLCRYILHEIPTLLYGIKVKQKHYNSMIYPAPSSASIDKICVKLTEQTYSMTLLKPPFCNIHRYPINV